MGQPAPRGCDITVAMMVYCDNFQCFSRDTFLQMIRRAARFAGLPSISTRLSLEARLMRHEELKKGILDGAVGRCCGHVLTALGACKRLGSFPKGPGLARGKS